MLRCEREESNSFGNATSRCRFAELSRANSDTTLLWFVPQRVFVGGDFAGL